MANKRFEAAKVLISKSTAKRSLERDLEFLTTLVEISEQVQKFAVLTICFLSRWDRRK